jgi:hypothetical protein
MILPWLTFISIVSLMIAAGCAICITIDLIHHPQKMSIMNVVWPVTALYLGPAAIWLYFHYGRLSSKDARTIGDSEAAEREKDPVRAIELRTGKPFWVITAIGVTHCGAGCTLGDIIAETTIFVTGFMLWKSQLGTYLIGDYILAYLLGIFFQYMSIAPMRGISGIRGIWAAVKADTLSLTAFEVGLFLWMWGMDSVFRHSLTPNEPLYWFSMQIGMAIGFCTAYPMNWWLIQSRVKEAM